MKKILAVAVFASVAILVAQPTNAAVTKYRAMITHDQEPPGTIPDEGSGGTGVFFLNDDNPLSPSLSYDIQLFGLDLDGLQTPGDANDNATRTHFHAAAFGINGGIVFGQIDGNPSLRNDLDDLMVDPVLGTIKGVWDNAEGNGTTLAARITAGDFVTDVNNRIKIYFNVHTTDHAGGEVRGQLTLVPEPASLLLVLGLLCGAPLCCTRRRSR
jgi:hypothetical protein